MSRRLEVLQVGTSDVGGGAERVMTQLQEAYLSRGVDAWLAVGRKHAADDRVLEIPRDTSALTRLRRRLRRATGRQAVDFPGTARILDLPPRSPDVLHLHNLHGDYFDLRALPRLTAAAPSIMTLHDAWLLTGHCAHPFECRRWLSGCGACPHPDVYVPIRRDRSDADWREKRDVIAASRLRFATPSRWLMGLLEESGMLQHALDARVVPNGVDTRVFKPGDKREARALLRMEQDAEVLLFAANALRENPFKDYETLLAALPRVVRADARRLQLVALGDESAAHVAPGVEVRAVPFEPDPAAVARYYQAADLYVHSARAENLPLAPIEAMACGTPVVASDVGGLPEIVEEGATGSLVPVGDAEALATAVVALLEDEERRHAFAQAGQVRVAERFTLDRQADAYLGWYEEIAGTRA
jgi:glycosyltransferase involved in cell wall biosynthesis